MTDQAQIRVRLIVDDSAGSPRSGAARQKRRRIGESGKPLGEPREASKKSKPAKPKSRIRETVGEAGRFGKRVAGGMFRGTEVGAGATRGLIARGGKMAGLGKLAAGAGAVVGAAEIFRQVIPVVNAAVAEAVGVGDNPIFTKISEMINTAFSEVGAAIGAVGPTVNFMRGAALTGMDLSPEMIRREYGRRQAVDAQQRAVRSRWVMEQNQDVAREVVRQIMR